MRAEASLSRANGVLDALLAFYEAVLAERHVEILKQAVSNLEEAARVLSRREAAGSASGYESTRLAIACELARSHLAEARSAAGSATARLGVLLGLRPEALRVSTDLPLTAEDDETALAQGHGETHQAMQHARASL